MKKTLHSLLSRGRRKKGRGIRRKRGWWVVVW
jgi:hypothetical protein